MADPAPPVLTLADLESWSVPGIGLAVLGSPVAHSLSPAMHNAALAGLAAVEPSFAGWRYHKFEIAPAGLARALALLHARGFAGVNLTVPHKEAGLVLAESADAFARAAGAANTLVRTATGWHAGNTDGIGLARAIRGELGVDLSGQTVILLGAGGAARAAAAQCLTDGGASLYGGRGTIIGTLIGVFIMVMIRNGLNLLGVSPFWQGSAIGGIIIAAVLAERLLSPRSRR